ncbi:MAG: zinc-binding dehydrogenase [Rhodospirillaceae bacterium]|jgi:threonine dehydrogenase-like Zn-dependent dehydrogenase|nr:zinc-binding dehydrogenase [Rhodospirillaceae bacterium]MBT5194489.1 zinc-binding dehydrogenase [Rhodospirillaceae bacterium]MBT5895140.1 zinc-binding dehydrogenase [Rhodospirillaceae bacterium]MBT6431206.1 zinc-binding dehydrogenase [Rhodospirillaceae bacterium]MBT7757423.1 zinc-binding dehydrogenase [Rhodospirillaceae bacterium]
MQGVVFLGDRKLTMQQFDDPTPGPGEVVLEIKASGMCGSDLKFYRARSGGGAGDLGLGGDGGPVIAGHEPCGVVAAVGPGVTEAEARIGQRVMDHHYAGCGVCNDCRGGWSQLCRDGITVYGATGHGAHAKYMKVPVRTLVPLPDELSFETGAAISCGTGTAYGALRRIGLTGRDTVAVFGQGPVGLSAVQLAAAMGARVIALDVGAERLELAKSFGADACIDAGTDDPVAAIKDLTHGAGADRALDCSGAAAARLAAVQATRTWGTVGFVGEGGEVTLDVSRDMIRKQITIVASWTFSTIGQAECARFIADRKIDVDALFTHRWSLDQAEEAYQLFDQQTTGKGVFLS